MKINDLNGTKFNKFKKSFVEFIIFSKSGRFDERGKIQSGNFQQSAYVSHSMRHSKYRIMVCQSREFIFLIMYISYSLYFL